MQNGVRSCGRGSVNRTSKFEWRVWCGSKFSDSARLLLQVLHRHSLTTPSRWGALRRHLSARTRRIFNLSPRGLMTAATYRTTTASTIRDAVLVHSKNTKHFVSLTSANRLLILHVKAFMLSVWVVHWHHQLWGTGARAPLTSNNTFCQLTPEPHKVYN